MIGEDGPDDGNPFLEPRAAKATPGTRAPHVEIEREGQAISTLDLYGGNFVLLAGSDGHAWVDMAGTAAADRKLPFDAWSLKPAGKIADPSGGFAEAHGISPKGAVLIRPDGYVAWRAKDDKAASANRMADVLATILAR